MLIVGGNQSAGGYNVDNSLRFEDGSSDKLTRSTGTPDSEQIFTWSQWVKKTRGDSTYEIIQGFYNNSSNYLLVSFNQDRIDVLNYEGGVTARKITTAKFRDVSAWYHIVVAVDTTQGTADNRIKIYVNGVQETVFDTNSAPSLNANLGTNMTTTAIGVGEGGSIGYLSAYLAEVFYIDGTALDPTSFGEFDEDSGIWKPIDVSGLTFGTNGFYLPFENSAALGQDDSGNGNNFTVNNLTSIDQSTDTPTNNFATWNPLIYPTFTNHNLLDGNLTVEGETPSQNTAFSTFAVSSGKWFCEMKLTVEGNATSSVPNFGIASTADFRHADSEAYYETSGTNIYAGRVNSTQINHNGSASGTNLSSAADVGDIMGLALDLDSGTKTLKFYLNGSLVGTVNINTDEYCFITAVKEDDNKATVQGNFGGTNTYTVSSGNSDGNGYGNFEYAVPSGYYALCTKNLAEYG